MLYKQFKKESIDRMKKIMIVVPVYNEESTIGELIKQLKESWYSFIIVNDGSTDNTINFIRGSNVFYFTYSNNKGKGYAVKYGERCLKYIDKDYVLVMDSDGQNLIEDIPQFLTALKFHKDAAIIIGNRLHYPKGMPFVRFLTNKFLSWIISIMAGKKIYDTQCGFRLIRRDVFDLNLYSDRFEFESEMLIKAGKAGLKIVNVPITCVYFKNRKSKIRPIIDGLRFLKLFIKSYYG